MWLEAVSPFFYAQNKSLPGRQAFDDVMGGFEPPLKVLQTHT